MINENLLTRKTNESKSSSTTVLVMLCVTELREGVQNTILYQQRPNRKLRSIRLKRRTFRWSNERAGEQVNCYSRERMDLVTRLLLSVWGSYPSPTFALLPQLPKRRQQRHTLLLERNNSEYETVEIIIYYQLASSSLIRCLEYRFLVSQWFYFTLINS